MVSFEQADEVKNKLYDVLFQYKCFYQVIVGKTNPEDEDFKVFVVASCVKPILYAGDFPKDIDGVKVEYQWGSKQGQGIKTVKLANDIHFKFGKYTTRFRFIKNYEAHKSGDMIYVTKTIPNIIEKEQVILLYYVDGTTELVPSDVIEHYPDGVFAGWAREARKRNAKEIFACKSI